jgi:hypothetical protein
VGEDARIISSIASSLVIASKAFFGRFVSSLLIKQASATFVGGFGETMKNYRMNNVYTDYTHIFHISFASCGTPREFFLVAPGVVGGWVLPDIMRDHNSPVDAKVPPRRLQNDPKTSAAL